MKEVAQSAGRGGLKATLAGLDPRSIFRNLDTRLRGIEPVRLRQTVLAIEAAHGDLHQAPPPAYDLEETWTLVKGLQADGWAIDRMPKKHQQRSPWVVFHPVDRPARWLGADQGFQRAYVEWLANLARPSTVAAMVQVFIRHYPKTAPTFQTWRAAMRSLVRKDTPRLRKWRMRCDLSSALEPDGDEKLAQTWLRTTTPKAAFLEQAGLSGNLSAAAFLQDSMRALLTVLRKDLSKSTVPLSSLRRGLDFLTVVGDPDRLHFGELKPALAENLFLPFSRKMPDPDVQSTVQDFVLRTIGDPRLRPERWQGINAEVRQIFLRWLAGATLETFFKIIEMTAPTEDWEPRRRFWSAYFEKGFVNEAWVAFGRLAADVASRDDSFSKAGVSKLEGPADARHSILLMRLGGLTILEASHNGLCLGWLAGSPYAPALYREAYRKSDYSRRGYQKDVAITHRQSQEGYWQSQMAGWIQRQTGISLQASDYMPGRSR